MFHFHKRHKNLSRPFKIDGVTYKTCFDCGEHVLCPEWELVPAYHPTQDRKPLEPEPLTGIEREFGAKEE